MWVPVDIYVCGGGGGGGGALRVVSRQDFVLYKNFIIFKCSPLFHGGGGGGGEGQGGCYSHVLDQNWFIVPVRQ